MFNKILIANRGEIACRVAATARRLNVASVAVYSDADAKAKHVDVCDEAVHVGGSAASESYLRIERIVEAAKATGAQAVHPGYGFLSENEEFASACEQAGIVFIGPPVGAIRAMGSKAAAKALMQSASVPLVPGYHGDDQGRGAAATGGGPHRLSGTAEGERGRRWQRHARGRAQRRLHAGARVVQARGGVELRQRPRVDREVSAASATRRSAGLRGHARQRGVSVRSRLARCSGVIKRYWKKRPRPASPMTRVARWAKPPLLLRAP